MVDTASTASSADSLLKIESEADKPDRHLRYFTFFASLSQIFGILMIFLTGYLNGSFFDGYQWGNVTSLPQYALGLSPHRTNGNLNYHATFMTFGFVFLQGEAILMYRLFRHESKMFSKVLHGVFHLFAFILIVFGLIAVVVHKNIKDIPHVYSAHSWIGVTLIALFIVQFLIGFINFFFPKTSPTVRAWFLPVHKGLGLLVFGLSCAQAFGGQLERNTLYQFIIVSALMPGQTPGTTIPTRFIDCYPHLNCNGGVDYIDNFCTVFLVLYALTVVFIVANPNFARRKTPDEE
jgi:cytochrome b-561